MKMLWVYLILQSFQLPIFGQATFGTSFLDNSKLCRSWTCLNNKLGLPNALPPREQYEVILKSLLPEGWHGAEVDKVLDTCYNNRTIRTYTNTCPGQALMHCVVDNFIENCPDAHLKRGDACTPVSSTAGLKYMFSQSRYLDFENNLPKERRPAWFLRNYFNTKCCDLQPLFNQSILTECGVGEFMHFYDHEPQYDNVVSFNSYKKHATVHQQPIAYHIKLIAPKKTPATNVDAVKIVEPTPTTNPAVNTPTPTPNVDAVKVVDHPSENDEFKNLDPLDCCDVSNFIQPAWRAECDFGLTWDSQDRLAITKFASPTDLPATAAPEPMSNDVKIVPLSCESETCVFNKLNVLSPSGDVNLDSFTKLLDNFTANHPEFTKAKARVITECMTKPLLGYDEECQINKVLACTFDVLSEYCPYTDRKHDPCKDPKSNMMCQISSSQFRPKFRRSFCSLPNFVPVNVLAECGAVSLSQMKYVPQRAGKKHHTVRSGVGCQTMTESTSCLLNKLSVLSKYKFLDYFKMKDRIRTFTNESEWTALTDVYISAFTNKPMYSNHCNSPRQLLNVIDTMLMTCPASLRKQTPQCNRFFTATVNTAPYSNSNLNKVKLDQLINHFHHVFLPVHLYHPTIYATSKPSTQYKPLYNYGVLSSGKVPPVSIIDVKPKNEKKPLMILPVYMRMHNQGVRYPGTGQAVVYNNPLLRSGPLGETLGNAPAKPNMI